MSRLLPGLALLALLAPGSAAQAQDSAAARAPEAAAPAPPPPPAADSRPRVRSSHTVDVIAPGESVDTILGRMRVERPERPARADPAPRSGTATRPPPGPDARDPGAYRPAGPRKDRRDGERARSPRTDGARPPPPPPSSTEPPPPR